MPQGDARGCQGVPGGCQGDAPGGCQGDARGVPKGCRRGARRGARLEPAAVRCACRRRGACPSRCAGCAACRRSAGGASTARPACRAGPHLPCATRCAVLHSTPERTRPSRGGHVRVHRTCSTPLRPERVRAPYVHRTAPRYCTPYVHRSVRAPLRACTAPCVHRSVRAPLRTYRSVRAPYRSGGTVHRACSTRGPAPLVQAWPQGLGASGPGARLVAGAPEAQGHAQGHTQRVGSLGASGPAPRVRTARRRRWYGGPGTYMSAAALASEHHGVGVGVEADAVAARADLLLHERAGGRHEDDRARGEPAQEVVHDHGGDQRLACGAAHGTRYARHARGGYAYGVRAVRGGPGTGSPVPPVRTTRRRLVRVARAHSTCQHSDLPMPVGSETRVFSKRAAWLMLCWYAR